MGSWRSNARDEKGERGLIFIEWLVIVLEIQTTFETQDLD